jgi:hypothetical protein
MISGKSLNFYVRSPVKIALQLSLLAVAVAAFVPGMLLPPI